MVAATASLLVFLAFVGYTILQFGCSQPKNTSSIIINNVLSLVIACIMFWTVGFAFALGPSGNGFMSWERFFLMNATAADIDSWFFEFTILAIYIALFNGSFAERLKFCHHQYLAVFFAGWVYPIATHWMKHKKGWLLQGVTNSNNELIIYQDPGGVSALHITAGGVAAAAALLVRARPERKDPLDNSLKKIGGETNTNIFLGATLVLFGLAAKNVAIYKLAVDQSNAVVNTFLAACTSSLVAFIFKRSGVCGENWNTKTLLNGAIMGVVAVSSNPGMYHSYGAFAIGVVAGCTFVVWNVSLKACCVDDISDIITVNLGGGILAVLAAPLFHKTTGIFYSGKVESFQVFGWNMLGCIVPFFWHFGYVFSMTWWSQCKGNLTHKTSSDAHGTGLDIYEHEEPAYPAKETFPDAHKPLNDLATITDMKDLARAKAVTNEVYEAY
eukprot:Seg2156.2 transcript_id=Seg2156.2/GoldUCD/mRNA.D3Y31 product="putative ammonium transporter 1" protein_id=Seg2156.2/GoldUCD/D3Y31